MINLRENDDVVGFIDMGTNSVRLLVVRIRSNHSYAVITQQKEMVRLGEGEFATGKLQSEAMNRTALVCRKFADLARFHGAREIIGVATAATREADNKTGFLHRLREESRVDFHVISGLEEARLVYLGIASGISLDTTPTVFIDIGGGSTEVILGNADGYHLLDSLRLGALRLGMLYLPDAENSVPADRYRQLCQAISHRAIRIVQRIRPTAPTIAYGSSGTIENLVDITIRGKHDRNPQPYEGITLTELRGTVRYLCGLSLSERRKVPGINPDRADIIVSGAAILETLMHEMGLQEIRFSPRGLRDGLLIDYLERSDHAVLISQGSVRERSVLQLGRTCNFDEGHAGHVVRLALELFDSAKASKLHTLGAQEREWLEHAARLHDVGAFLSYQDHHLHSYYFILNYALLGFNQAEQEVIAAVAYYHRKTWPRKSHPVFARLESEQQKTVRILAVLLRLAESLDRSHLSLVTAARLTRGKAGTVLLEFTAQDDCVLELLGIENHQEAIRKLFKRILKVRVRHPHTGVDGIPETGMANG